MPSEPNLKFGGFSLWVAGQQFPESHDFWDGNWLEVRVRTEAPGAYVEHLGPFLRTTEIEEFCQQISRLDTTLAGEAKLSCMEPNLSIGLLCDALGRVAATVSITPDHMTQVHKFQFSVDQTYLTQLLAECKSILSEWPIVSPRG